MNRKSIRAIAIGLVVLCIVITLGFVFQNRQPADYTHLSSTNWFLAVPFLLMLPALVVMGYLTDKKLQSSKTHRSIATSDKQKQGGIKLKKRVLIGLIAIALLACGTFIGTPLLASAQTSFWSGTATASVVEPMVVKVDGNQTPLDSGWTWDAGSLKPGETATLKLWVYNNSTVAETVVPTISPSSPDVLTSWSDDGGVSIPAGGNHSFTLTLTAVNVGTGYSFAIGFTRTP
jgi:hypothetical protein